MAAKETIARFLGRKYWYKNFWKSKKGPVENRRSSPLNQAIKGDVELAKKSGG